MSLGFPTNQAMKADAAVAELQGLYGPFAFPEKLLQKIWARGAFDTSRAVLADGRRVALVRGGRWNLLGGPDFKGARLRIGAEVELSGDIELHLRAGDWEAHGHAQDPAYDEVILHVVLFPPAVGYVTRGAGGREIPVLALLPLLHHDLEEYAAEEAVETLANRPASHVLERLGPLSPEELSALVDRYAAERWRQKVHFARLRVQRLGWDEACHQTTLEILGYRFNRAPMLRVAAARPLVDWSDVSLDPDRVFEAEKSGWSLQGLRPANHPRRRMKQYATWVRARPDWTARLAALGPTLPRMAAGLLTGEARRLHALTKLRAEWAEALGAGALDGTRWDTLVCDGFLPLVATQPAGEQLRGLWYHWFAGDMPPFVLRSLRQLQVFSGRSSPACHGGAQALLGWLIETERATGGQHGR